MNNKTVKWFESLNIDDYSKYDLNIIGAKRLNDANQTTLLIMEKSSPWTADTVLSFRRAYYSIPYPVEFSWQYLKPISLFDIQTLFDEWISATGKSQKEIEFEYISNDHSRLRAVVDKDNSFDVKADLNEFNSLLNFITYNTQIIDARLKEIEIEEEPEVVEDEYEGEEFAPLMDGQEIGMESSDYEDNSEILDQIDEEHQEKLKVVESGILKEYESTLQRKKFSRSGSYNPVKCVHDLYGLDPQYVEFSGTVFEADAKLTKKGKMMGIFGIKDSTSGIIFRCFESSKITKEDIGSIKIGKRFRIRGKLDVDKFSGEKCVMANEIIVDDYVPMRDDNAPEKRVELHLHAKMSVMDATGEMQNYCKLAQHMGMDAIAITDHGNIQSFSEAQTWCGKCGLKPIYGCEFYMFEPQPRYVFNPQDVDLLNAKYCILDLETTGLSAMFDRITEFGCVIVQNGLVIKPFDTFINPECQIPKFIQEKTHISQEDVDKAPTFEQIVDKLLELMDGCILVTHNASFDIGFLNENLIRIGRKPLSNPVIDTLPISHYLFPYKKYHNLGAFCRNLGVTSYNAEEAHRADFDAKALSDAFGIALPKLIKYGYKSHKDLANMDFSDKNFDGVNYEDPEKAMIEMKSSFYKNIRSNHAICLVKNTSGLKDLYRLVSMSNTTYLAEVPKIPKEEIQKYRKDLLVGSACFNGEVFSSAMYDGYEELKKVMSFYDYIELQPKENYSFLVNDRAVTEERLQQIIDVIIKAAKELNIPLVATGDVHYVDPEDKIARDVFIYAKAIGGTRHPLNPARRDRMPQYDNPDQYFRSTEDMLEIFEEMTGDKDLAYEMVVTNTRAIADQISSDISPFSTQTFPPDANLPDSKERLIEICHENLRKRYGENPDPLVKQRLEKELDGIIGNGYSVTYYIAHLIIKKATEEGFFVGSRGSVGSSFAATMADITEVNPLAPHYICPKCHHFEWANRPDIRSGFDLPEKVCPDCGEVMIKDGQSIPFETFLGFNADKVPDIDLNFDQEYQSRAHDYTREILGPNNCFRAGTIETVAEKTAFGYVRGYYEKIGLDPDKVPKAHIAAIASACQGVKRTTGQHPGGIVVIPSDMDIFDFTPYQHPADDINSDWLTTHYDYRSMHDEALKLDLLGHVDPLALRKISIITGRDFKTVPMDDPKVLSIFSKPDSLGLEDNPLGFKTGAVGLPEFGTNFVRGLLSEALPKSFNDLLIISGLSHGTDVWNNNAQDLIKDGVTDLNGVIGCRDDIMNYLISMGVEDGVSFKIMEIVRKGKKLSDEQIQTMKDHGIPDYYIESCKKIKYLFPRAHATAYVMGAVRMAWFKVYMPLHFYAIYFSVRCNKYDIKSMIDGKEATLKKYNELKARSQSRQDPLSATEKEVMKTLLVAVEMLDRGYKFSNINLYKSDASDFVVDEETKSLIPPFIVLDQLGLSAAESVIEARKDGEFISKEDLHNRTKLSDTNIKMLDELGSLGDMGEKNQMSLFEFF